MGGAREFAEVVEDETKVNTLLLLEAGVVVVGVGVLGSGKKVKGEIGGEGDGDFGLAMGLFQELTEIAEVNEAVVAGDMTGREKEEGNRW